MRSVRLPAFAKVNLRLDILGKRPDGYHELRTIFQSISLHDTLQLELTRGSRDQLTLYPQIELSAMDAAGLRGPNNLVWRALDALRRELKIRSRVRAELIKRIPVGRGLGGGSSDAAAALLGFLRLTGRTLSLTRLAEIASSLGADVPFFLWGGRAVGVSRGDEIYPLPSLPGRTVVVVSPHDIAVSTKEAYAWFARRASRRRLTFHASASKLWCFCALCWSPPGGSLSNDFEPAVFARHPRLARIKRELLRQGAAGAALAGSGSAVFGVFQNPAQARRAARWFPKDQVYVCKTHSRGEYRRAGGGV